MYKASCYLEASLVTIWIPYFQILCERLQHEEGSWGTTVWVYCLQRGNEEHDENDDVANVGYHLFWIIWGSPNCHSLLLPLDGRQAETSPKEVYGK
jgi:hypothetical protein